MEIILLQKIENLGDIGDIVKVKIGYARNYLVPYGKAKLATPENIEAIEIDKAQLKKQEQELLDQAEKRKQKIDGLNITTAVKVTDEGVLFGSVGSTDIIEAIKEISGEEVKRSEVLLPDGAFHELGEQTVSVRIHPSVIASIRLNITAEE